MLQILVCGILRTTRYVQMLCGCRKNRILPNKLTSVINKLTHKTLCILLDYIYINFNIILISTPISSRRSLSFRFTHQDPHLHYVYYVYKPSHPPPFDHPKILKGVRTVRPFIMQFTYLPVLKHRQSTPFLQCYKHSFAPTYKKKQNYSFIHFNFHFLNSRWSIKYCESNGTNHS